MAEAATGREGALTSTLRPSRVVSRWPHSCEQVEGESRGRGTDGGLPRQRAAACSSRMVHAPIPQRDAAQGRSHLQHRACNHTVGAQPAKEHLCLQWAAAGANQGVATT